MRLLRLAIAGVLGAATALLVACGSGGANLIPAGNAGPLQNDFDAIATNAANGNCSALSGAFARAQQDITALPATVDPRLHSRLEQGLADLRRTAPQACAQNTTRLTNTTPTNTTPTDTTPTNTTPTNTTPTNTTPTDTTPTNTTPTDTTPTNTTPTTPPPAPPGGGTPVPPSGGSGGGAGGAAPGNGTG